MDVNHSTEPDPTETRPIETADPGIEEDQSHVPGKIEVYERPKNPLFAQPKRLALAVVLLLLTAVLVLWFLWYVVL